MSKWIDSSEIERRQMLRGVAAKKGFVENAAEKDWWVTMVLKALFSMDVSKYLLFKGGTSLSKGWNLIKRFSEDIDLLISRDYFIEQHLPFAACENNQQIKLLRRASRDFLTGAFCESLGDAIRQLGVNDFVLVPVVSKEGPDGIQVPIDHDSDPVVLELQYTSILPTQYTYVMPTVKIEISCLGMMEPYKQQRITSLMYDEFPEEDNEMCIDVATVLPSRTFLEKAFLLNEEFQRPKPRSERMSRHLYDLEKMMDTSFAAEALADKVLYDAVIEHRKRFYHVGGVDYARDARDVIDFVPHGAMRDAFRTDYEAMLATYVYDHRSALTFERLIDRMEELKKRFRTLASIEK